MFQSAGAPVTNHSRTPRRATIVFLALIGATFSLSAESCEPSDIFGSVVVPAEDGTPPTAGLEIRSGGQVLYTAPYVAPLKPTHPGALVVIATGGDKESGLRALQLFTTTTKTTCPANQSCTAAVSHTSGPLGGSFDKTGAAVGERVLQSGITSAEIDDDALVPPNPPDGSSITVQVDVYARATNYTGGAATSPKISLTYSAGEHAPPAETGNLSFRITFTALAGMYCEANPAVYTYTPKSLNGSAGVASQVVHERYEKVFVGTGTCTFQDIAFGLRPGTWLAQADFSGGYVGRCNIYVRPGETAAVTLGEDGVCR